MSNLKSAVLYISYDGMLEPLGQSQVVSYLEILSADYDIYLISFEKKSDLNNSSSFNKISKRMQSSNIHWRPLKYHKNPSAIATLFDVIYGFFVATYLCYKNDIKIIHSRSYVASLIALQLKMFFKVKFVFDMRGFWADERVDGGLWKESSKVFKFTKWLERKYLTSADVVISLTHSAVEHMKKFNYLKKKSIHYQIIPTCVNLEKFTLPKGVKSEDECIVGYVGSVGVWYLFDEVLKTFKIIKSRIKNAKLLIVNRGGHDEILKSIYKYDIDLADIDLVESDHEKIAEYMKVMGLAIYFYKPSISRLACSPTKLGEFLACGIPVISNTGVGDQDEIIHNNENPVGVIVKNFDKQSVVKAVDMSLNLIQADGIHERCRGVAENKFSLIKGSTEYSKIYQQLINKG